MAGRRPEPRTPPSVTEPHGTAQTGPVDTGSANTPVRHDARHTRYHGVVCFRCVSVAKNGFVMMSAWIWLVAAVAVALAAMIVLRPAAADTPVAVGAPAPA